MTQTEKAILAILKNELFHIPVTFQNLEYNALYREASLQSISPIIYDWLKRSKSCKLPADLDEKWKSNTFGTIIYNEKLKYEQSKVVNILRNKGISCVVLKGTSAAAYYPNPDLRILGDIDILVEPQRQMEAVSLLQSYGYGEIYDKEHHCHMTVNKNGIVVEVHKEPNGLFISMDDDVCRGIREFFSTAVENLIWQNGVPVLADKYQMIVLIMHKLEHFVNGSLGLRQLCDWAVFVNSRMTESLWKEMKNYLADFGLLYFTGVITRVSIDFLGLPKEKAEWAMEYDENLACEVIEEIMRSGNFGNKKNVEEYGQSHFTNVNSSNPISSFFKAFVLACKRNWEPCEKIPMLLPIGAVALLIRHIKLRKSKQRSAFRPFSVMKQAKAKQDLYKSLKPFVVENDH